MANYYVDPAATGAANGTSWTDAWTTLDSGLSTAAAGDVVYLRGTQTVGVGQAQVVDNSGSLAAGYVKFIGCNAAGEVDGTRYVMNVALTQTQCIYTSTARTFIWLENIEINSGVYAVDPNGNCDHWVFNNCYFHDQTTYSLRNAGNLRYFQAFRCTFASITRGVDGGINPLFAGCKFLSCGTGCYQIVAGRFNNCLVLNCTTAGLRLSELSNLENCILHGNGIGLDFYAGSVPSRVLGCRFTANTTGIVNAGNLTLANSYLQNTTDITNTGLLTYLNIDGSIAHVVTSGADTDYGYVNSAGGDFNLASTATGRNFAIEID